MSQQGWFTVISQFLGANGHSPIAHQAFSKALASYIDTRTIPKYDLPGFNQGIDSHLEAVHTTEIAPGNFTVNDSQSMRVFLRRLMDYGSEESELLASDIMQTLGYEWI